MIETNEFFVLRIYVLLVGGIRKEKMRRRNTNISTSINTSTRRAGHALRMERRRRRIPLPGRVSTRNTRSITSGTTPLELSRVPRRRLKTPTMCSKLVTLTTR